MENAPKKTKSRAPGRPSRNLIKTGIAMNAEALALAEKIGRSLGVARITAMEMAIREEAARRNITVTPEEIEELTKA